MDTIAFVFVPVSISENTKHLVSGFPWWCCAPRLTVPGHLGVCSLPSDRSRGDGGLGNRCGCCLLLQWRPVRGSEQTPSLFCVHDPASRREPLCLCVCGCRLKRKKERHQ
jgi:hypothetical protein